MDLSVDIRQLLMLLLAAAVSCYKEGAPTSHCLSMEPGHGRQSAQDNPYNITVNSTSYGKGGAIRVTVSGHREIRGILMSAQYPDIPIIIHGAFIDIDPYFHTINCQTVDDAITHNDGDEVKSRASFIYRMPRNFTDTFNFVATILITKMEYWTNVQSPKINYDTKLPVWDPPSTPPPTTTAKTKEFVDGSCKSVSQPLLVVAATLLTCLLLAW